MTTTTPVLRGALPALLILLPLPQLGNAAQAGSDKDTVEVIRRARGNDGEAILELGRRGDRSVIPLLKEKRKKENRRISDPGTCAQMALARLGDEAELRSIVAEARSDNPREQHAGIKKLTYVGGETAIKTLGPLLFGSSELRPPKARPIDQKDPRKTVVPNDMSYPPASYMAAKALSRIVTDIPRADRDIITDEYVSKWRKWWDDYRKTHGIKDDKGK